MAISLTVGGALAVLTATGLAAEVAPGHVQDESGAVHETIRHSFRVETVAAGLEIPWGLAFLPDGRLLVTEKRGALRIVETDGSLSEPVGDVPAVHSEGQGGLMDVALHPEYEHNRWIYLSYSDPRTDSEGNAISHTAIERARLGDSGLRDRQVVYAVDEKLYTQYSLHFGSRFAFDSQGFLY